MTTPNEGLDFDSEEYSSIRAEKYLLPESQSVFKCPKTPNPKIEKAVPSNQCRNLYINYHNSKRYAESSSSDSLPDNPSKRVKTEVKTFTGISHLDEICIFEILKYLESEDLVNCMKIEMFSKIVEKYESSLLKQVYEYKYKLVDVQDLYNILRPDSIFGKYTRVLSFQNSEISAISGHLVKLFDQFQASLAYLNLVNTEIDDFTLAHLIKVNSNLQKLSIENHVFQSGAGKMHGMTYV